MDLKNEYIATFKMGANWGTITLAENFEERHNKGVAIDMVPRHAYDKAIEALIEYTGKSREWVLQNLHG